MKYAEVAPWHNMQKYQVPYGTNKQQVDNMKPGNKKHLQNILLSIICRNN